VVVTPEGQAFQQGLLRQDKGCNGFKLKERRCRLDRRKKFFTMRVMGPWHRLPREVVDAPSLETFKARLDGALSNLSHVKVALLMAGGLDQMAFEGPFQP